MYINFRITIVISDRDVILAYLLSHGLEDPEGYLVRTLEDWNVPDDKEEVDEVQKSTSDWLLHWKEELNTSQQGKKGTTPTKSVTHNITYYLLKILVN